MSHGYRAIQWTPYKRRYDMVLLCAVLGYIAAFFIAGKLGASSGHGFSDEILLIRATGTCAFAMLSFTLCIGPLARLDRRFLPLLYNRRHLGVATFGVGLVHGLLVLGFYHGFGVISPPISLLTSNTQYGSIAAFPFEVFGVLALIILLLMAATSHDFWLKNLSPKVWKGMHMMVYVAWMLLVMHVALGAIQAQKSVTYVVMLAVAVMLVAGLHIAAGTREVRKDGRAKTGDWIDACAVDDIAEGRAKVVSCKSTERIAVFNHNGKLSAVGNVCAHQGGPLGEGRIIDGCITCPWHGFQYGPEDGCAPPPFTEKIPTYAVRVENGRVLVNIEEIHVPSR